MLTKNKNTNFSIFLSHSNAFVAPRNNMIIKRNIKYGINNSEMLLIAVVTYLYLLNSVQQFCC